ncbi:oligosaccharide flippase family protein [bacterium]|nr:oligosaccharide flippase family protein [bacterium]
MNTGSILKKLTGETAVYGLSSIVGRFLNWLLVPVYTRVLPETSDYGIVTNLYGWTALFLVILTYGMETGLFRFISREEDKKGVYGTILTALAVTSTAFALLVLIFIKPIASAMNYAGHWNLVCMLAVIVAMDAFTSLPFAYLRYEQRPLRFAAIKLISIAINIGLNLFFLIGAPFLAGRGFNAVRLIWNENRDMIDYIFITNVVSSLFALIALAPSYLFKWRFDAKLFKLIFGYSFPILLFGIAGIFNQTADKILFPYIFSDKAEANSQLGIYGACFKIAVVMVMALQAFRYAYEPFIFKYKKGDDTSIYAVVTHYFIIFSMTVFLAVTLYLDIFKHFISEKYYSGLAVVPIVLLGEFFYGIYSNLSIWYKLTDRTRWGTYFSVIACAVTVLVIILFVPGYGFIACAWASFFSNLIIMVLSYIFGQKYFPIAYRIAPAALNSAAAVAIFFISSFFTSRLPMPEKLALNTCLMALYLIFIALSDADIRRFIFRKLKIRGGN